MSDLLERVYRLMSKHDIKPTQLAKQLGMSTSTFTDWSKGKGSPSLKAVMQFAEYFDVSLDYLVYGKEHQTHFQSGRRCAAGVIPSALSGTPLEGNWLH